VNQTSAPAATWPQPLAAAYISACQPSPDSIGLGELLNAIVGYLAVLGLAATIRDGALGIGGLVRDGEQLRDGDREAWLSLLQDILSKASSDATDPVVAELVRWWRTPSRDTTIGDGLRELGTSNDGRLETLLTDVCAALGQLVAWPLVAVRSRSAVSGGTGGYAHAVTVLAGAHPVETAEPMTLAMPLTPGRVYLLRGLDGVESPLSLHPFLVHARCEGCGDARVYMLSGFDATVAHYSSAQCPHGLTSVPLRAELAGMLARRDGDSPQAHVLDEDVQFTVYRPNTVRPETWYDMLAFAHKTDPSDDASSGVADPVAEVHRQADAYLGEQRDEYRALSADSTGAVARGAELRFVPRMDGVEFNPPQLSFLWLEPVHRETFRFRAARSLDGQQARGRLSVFLGAMCIGQVSLSVRVDSQPQVDTAATPTEKEWGRPYRKIFASYSHRDADVVQHVGAFARVYGGEFILDKRNLRIGEEWSPRLQEMIAEADIFELFWSRNSMASPQVHHEWEYALSLGRPGFVFPVYWESPFPEAPDQNLPPSDLRNLHFELLAPEQLPSVFDGSPTGAAEAAPSPEPPPAPPQKTGRGTRWLLGGGAGGIAAAAAGVLIAVSALGHHDSLSPPAGIGGPPPPGATTGAAAGPQTRIESVIADVTTLCVTSLPQVAHIDALVNPGSDSITSVTLLAAQPGQTPAPIAMQMVRALDPATQATPGADGSLLFAAALGPYQTAGPVEWRVSATFASKPPATATGHVILVDGTC
jgi:hypothetical protein